MTNEELLDGLRDMLELVEQWVDNFSQAVSDIRDVYFEVGEPVVFCMDDLLEEAESKVEGSKE